MTDTTPAEAIGVPAIIAAAGEQAVKQYRAYHDLRRPSTRSAYRSYYRRFFGWAEKRGLSLNDISASDAAEFVGECCLPATVSESAQINPQPSVTPG